MSQSPREDPVQLCRHGTQRVGQGCMDCASMKKVAGEELVETIQGLLPTAVADLLAALDENPAWTLD